MTEGDHVHTVPNILQFDTRQTRHHARRISRNAVGPATSGWHRLSRSFGSMLAHHYPVIDWFMWRRIDGVLEPSVRRISLKTQSFQSPILMRKMAADMLRAERAAMQREVLEYRNMVAWNKLDPRNNATFDFEGKEDG